MVVHRRAIKRASTRLAGINSRKKQSARVAEGRNASKVHRRGRRRRCNNAFTKRGNNTFRLPSFITIIPRSRNSSGIRSRARGGERGSVSRQSTLIAILRRRVSAFNAEHNSGSPRRVSNEILRNRLLRGNRRCKASERIKLNYSVALRASP